MSVKSLIIPEKCIACGLCQVIAPEIFDYDEEGIVCFKNEPEATQQFIPKNLAADLIAAYRKCPVRAILVEE